jgi:hypothetical protein
LGNNQIKLATAPTIRKWVGKGNYDKYDMLSAFMQNKMGDKLLPTNGLYKLLHKKGIHHFYKEKTKKGKIIKEVLTPISDIIDSYFVCLFMKNHYEK